MTGLTNAEVEAKQGTPCPLCQGWDEKCQHEFHMRTVWTRRELWAALDAQRAVVEQLLGLEIERTPTESGLCLMRALHEAREVNATLDKLVATLEAEARERAVVMTQLYDALQDADGWVNYLRINGCDGGAVVSALARIRAARATESGEVKP